jgi:hypothetical protein
MNTTFKIVIYLALVLSLVCFADVHYHEAVHEIIFLDDGCENVEVKNNIYSGYTMCLDKDYRMSESAELQHNLNEIKAYNDMPIKILLFLIFGMLVINGVQKK